jgi:ribosome-associated protein
MEHSRNFGPGLDREDRRPQAEATLLSIPTKDTEPALDSLEQARRIAALAQEKLAEDVVILDMRPVCSFTDYFVICTGRNPRQTAAVWDEVHRRLKQENGLTPVASDGLEEGTWVLADYLDVVLHVFTPEARDYYKLAELWGDVPAVELAGAATG